MKKIFIPAMVLVLAQCTTPRNTVAPPERKSSTLVNNGKLWGAAYQQKAAEYTALCYQAYHTAAYSLNELLQRIRMAKPIAVVTDIDETVLDNSPYAVHEALLQQGFNQQEWYNWTAKASASAVPGSLDFFNFAKEKNVTVFYLTNRDEKERAATLDNLKKLHFPFADEDHLILKNGSSSKEGRRNAIAGNYYIAMLIGDNLSDFSGLWDKKNVTERMQAVHSHAGEFGSRYIILPNINYGGWEDAYYGNRYTLTAAQKDSAIKQELKTY